MNIIEWYGDIMMKYTVFLSLIFFIRSVVLQLPDEYNTTTSATEESTQIPNTLFDDVDTRLYDGMVTPKNGSLCGEELLSDFAFMLACLKRAAGMWLDLSVPKDEAFRSAALTLFNIGGPRFIRVPVDEVADGMKNAYNWTEEKVKLVEEFQNKCEVEWNRLRRAIL